MNSWKRQAAMLKVTTLAAALMGVYGVAGAVPPSGPMVCTSNPCSVADDTEFSGDNTSAANSWVVQARNAGTELILNRAFVNATGNKNRGVGAASGAYVELNAVEVETVASSDDDYWGNHGVQAHGKGSRVQINGAVIDTTGQYSNGIQAEAEGEVSGTNVRIMVDGGSSYTFGVEAGDGGIVWLRDSSIEVAGEGSAGARAYTGTADKPSTIMLDGTDINAVGGAIGLMAGDTDGSPTSGSPGSITYQNGTVIAEQGPAARVRHGGTLTASNAVLETGTGTTAGTTHAVEVDGKGSNASLSNKTIVRTYGAGGGTGSLVAGVLASNEGRVDFNGGAIEALGDQYARGILATSNAQVHTDGTNIGTSGAHSHAVHAWGTVGSSTPRVFLSDGRIHTEGRESYGLSA